MPLFAWLLLPIGLGLLAALLLKRPGRSLEVNPHYGTVLHSLGLLRVEDFLDLRSVIISGHPNRNVGRVTLGAGPQEIHAFLKREHRVLWRDYLNSLLAGFGPVSRSLREARMLAELHRAGVHCPEVIAAGEDGNGRAFLLLRAVPGSCALRDLLRRSAISEPNERRRLAGQLGKQVAQMHRQGFYHADLNSTHVLVELGNGDISILDWQRSRQAQQVGWRHRTHDLAALDATLADELTAPRERLRFLCAYFRTAGIRGERRKQAAVRIRHRAHRLLRKRYVRELRHAPLPQGEQTLIWLDGEALCVTRAYNAELQGTMPRWLLPVPPQPDLKNWLSAQKVPGPGPDKRLLVQRIAHHPWRWLWSRLRGRPYSSNELRQAALLFRLQRYGLRTPTLLAVGQRHVQPWRTESFLLTEAAPVRENLADWLARCGPAAAFTAERKQTWRRLREAGRVLRRLHDAGCYLGGRLPLAVTRDGALAITQIDELEARRRPHRGLARNDLLALCRTIANAMASRADVARFLQGYVGTPRSPATTRAFLRALR